MIAYSSMCMLHWACKLDNLQDSILSFYHICGSSEDHTNVTRLGANLFSIRIILPIKFSMLFILTHKSLQYTRNTPSFSV